MPKWGMEMAAGTLVAWLKKEGDNITTGDELADVETEKIVNSMEAMHTGVLRRRVANEGDVVPVGGLLGILADADVPETEIDSFIETFRREFVVREATADTAVLPVTVSVAGKKIRYLVYGEGDTTLLLIHGLGGDLNNWLFNQNVWSETARVIALDLPGHGGSVKEIEQGSLEELSGIVSGFMDCIGINTTHVIGHSLGAAIAVELACKYPERIASLTMIAGAGPGTRVDRDFVEGFLTANRRKTIRPHMEKLFATPALINRDMIEGVLKARHIDGTVTCLKKIAEASIFNTGTLPREYLARLHIPMQVIWGREDQIAPADQTEALPEHIKISVIEGAGHMVHMEAAARLNALVSEFIAAAGQPS
jgi:pyruvate dehydrogenase E2 component (dihydrolipoamide acetyltransferase)